MSNPLEDYRKKILGNYPSLRTQIAMACLGGLVYNHLKEIDGYAEKRIETIVFLAYQIADKMILENENDSHPTKN